MRSAHVLAAALLASAAGCASVRASQARRESLQRGLDAHRYARPMEEVWDEVRRLLAERGYPLASEDAKAVGQPEMRWGDRLLSPARDTYPFAEERGLLQSLGVVGGKKGSVAQQGLSLDTGWRRTMDRYHADALQDAAGVQVVFHRIEENTTEHREGAPVRDLDLELQLVQRLEPESAERIATGTGR